MEGRTHDVFNCEIRSVGGGGVWCFGRLVLCASPTVLFACLRLFGEEAGAVLAGETSTFERPRGLRPSIVILPVAYPGVAARLREQGYHVCSLGETITWTTCFVVKERVYACRFSLRSDIHMSGEGCLFEVAAILSIQAWFRAPLGFQLAESQTSLSTWKFCPRTMDR